MSAKRSCQWLVGVLLAACLGGCNREPTDVQSGGRLPVVAGIPPVAHLVEQIGGQRVKVETLVHPGQDPHTFEPSPHQVVAIAQARAFFTIDMPFETMLIEKALRQHRKADTIDVTAGINKRVASAACCANHSGRPHERGDNGGLPDPHVWLAPPLVKQMAGNVAAALSRLDPPGTAEYEKNLVALVRRLDDLHARIQSKLAPHRGRAFYVFHPGFGYFADAYGLREQAIEVGGQSPSPKQLRTVIEQARADGVGVIFIQPQYDPRTAQVVADAVGGRVERIDGLRADFLADIEDIAERIDAALRDGRAKLIGANTP